MIALVVSILNTALGLWIGLVWAFVAVMHAKAVLERGEDIHWAFLAPLIVLGLIGWLVDVAFNWLVASWLFWDRPRELTFTSRLKRYKRTWSTTSRQHRWAVWFCRQANKFDKDHC